MSYSKIARRQRLAKRRGEGKGVHELLADTASLVPMGRLGRPEEVADLAVYLCSERASFLTGTNVVLDGGLRQDLH